MFMRKIRARLAAKAALSALIIALVGAGAATPAEARHHHRHHRAHVAHHARAHMAGRHHAGNVAMSANAAIVVDGATGRVIYAMNEDAPRHPASITKVMTLYLLFEQLSSGRVSLDDQIPISAHAAAQSPSKLGLRPGSSIRVEDAIKAIVTKSANDIAVAVAEFVGGSESEFAEEMTRKARSLGMEHTLYRNASGLPNNEQLTTARDLAILGRAIQDRFPRYYRYFSIHEFAFRGQRIHTHNHLMDRFEGMDGIKTGYTAASGFNLLSSVKRDGHYVVAVVMGGKSARSRDNYMEALLEKYIDEAGAPHATRVAEQDERAQEEAARQEAARQQAAKQEAARQEAARQEAARQEAARQEQARRAAQAEEDASRLSVAAVSPEPRPRPAYVSAPAQNARDNDETRVVTASIPPRGATAHASTTAEARDAASTVTPTLRWIKGPSGQAALRAATRFQPAGAAKAEVKPAAPASRDVKSDATVVAKDDDVSAQPKQVAAGKPPVSGWMIQIGATDDADKAAELLSKAKAQRGALLARAKPYTEKVHKGGETLYRARFAGLEEDRANAACKALKTSGFSCFATRN